MPSTITAFTHIPERSEATPGLWNSRFSELHNNIASLATDARSFFDPRSYGAVGDGSTNDSSAFANAVSAASTNRGVVVLSQGTYRIASQQTIPPTVTVLPAGGQLALDASVRVVMRGSVIPIAKQWITSASTGSVVFELHAGVPVVYPEWWGASAHTTDATTVSSVTALQAALNTGKNVALGPGIYGFSGTAELVSRANGQNIFGVGAWVDNSDPKGATKILRTDANTPSMLYLNAYNEQGVRDLTLDGNSAGTLLEDHGIRTTLRNLRLQRAGLTRYAMYINQTNLCLYDQLYFPDTIEGSRQTSGGHMSFLTALYSTIINAQSGEPHSESNVRIEGSDGLRFVNNFFDPGGTGAQPSIHIIGTCTNLIFDGLGLESSATLMPMVRVNANGANIRNVVFRDVRTLALVASGGSSVFQLTGGAGRVLSNVAINNWLHRDGLTASGRSLVHLSNVQGFDLRDVEVHSDNAFNLVDCTGGTRSDYVNVENANARSGATGAILLLCAQARVSRTNSNVSILAGTENLLCENVGGAVNITNLNNAATLLECETITDARGRATLGSRTSGVYFSFLTGGVPSLTSGTAAFWQDTSGNLHFIANFAGSQRSVRLTT